MPGHTCFELIFGREMRIPLDVMIGAENSDCSYAKFVAPFRRI